MEARYEHKTEQFGASFDTDYKVITQCALDCPACAFKAGKQEGIKEVVEWVRRNLLICIDPKNIPDVIRDEWQSQLKEIRLLRENISTLETHIKSLNIKDLGIE